MKGTKKTGCTKPIPDMAHGMTVLATVHAKIYFVAFFSPVGSELEVITNPAFL